MPTHEWVVSQWQPHCSQLWGWVLSTMEGVCPDLVSLGYHQAMLVSVFVSTDYNLIGFFVSECEASSINYFGFGNDWFHLFIQTLSLLWPKVTSCQVWTVKSFSTEKKLLHRNPATPRLVQNEDKNKQPTGKNTSVLLEQHKGTTYVQRAAQQCHFQLQLHLQRNC